MASMNLSPELKKQTDRLYYTDPIKFKRLAIWVAQGRKYGYSELDMAEALRRFWEHRNINDWYPYLDKILERAVVRKNGKATEIESKRYKTELKELPIETSGIGVFDAHTKKS